MENIRERLPEEFKRRIKLQLGEEYEEFLDSYDTPRQQGLRANMLSDAAWIEEAKAIWNLKPIPWCENGYFYDGDVRPGKSVFHEAGAIYIQEPSATSVVTIADIRPGDYVLDLCSAPGGKATQIASALQDNGILVANEIVPKRAKILSSNIERMGVCNAIVTNMSPQELEPNFRGFFDKIIVDAPCSGEGMFNKEPEAIPEWSTSNVEMCAARQREILACAYEMLRDGGVLVYSTCTFAPAEDEENARWFADEYDDILIDPIDVKALGLSSGDENIALGTARIWPHKSRGEGHFIARFIKGARSESSHENLGFRKESFKDNVYITPAALPSFRGMKIERAGVHLEIDLGKRVEPAFAVARAIRKSDSSFAKIALENMTSIDEFIFCETSQPEKYFAGDVISCDAGVKGWVIVTFKGQSLGWGKASNGVIKNHYPKGLRKTLNLY